MANKKNGNRRTAAASVGPAASSGDGGRISETIAVNFERIIKDTCRGFARAADWRQVSVVPRNGDRGAAGLETVCRLSEDHEGLHSGRYISVSVLRAANAVAIRGGYYDGYRQPRTVCSESVPLKEVTSRSLGCLLTEMHDRLCCHDRRKAT